MKNHQVRRVWRTHVPTVMAVALFVVVGILVGSPSLAQATVMPTLTVSKVAGSVGTVVTVTYGPANNGCGGAVFEPAAGFSSGSASLGYLGAYNSNGSSGSQDFVIPRVLGDPSAHTNAPVFPGSYQFVLTCDTSNEPATAFSVSVPFTVTAGLPPQFVGIASTRDGRGYWLAQAGGGVFSYGDAAFHGSLPGDGIVPTDQVTGIAATPDGKGYWLVSADGGVFAFGDAGFYGSLVSTFNNLPIVGMAATPDGKGYWLVASDESVFPFGDAKAYVSPGPYVQPNQPVVGIAATADGLGYWEVASDGGIFSYGDARFHGSLGGQPIVGMSADPLTGGYWEVAADGGIFAFDAPFIGSTGNTRLNQPVTGMAGTITRPGYSLVAADGGVFSFGGAQFCGSAA